MTDNAPQATTLPFSTPLRVSELAARKPTRFSLTPDAEGCAALAGRLGIEAVRKLSLTGELRPFGRGDFAMQAELGATVVQPCVVTSAPVTTRIDEVVNRRFLADMEQPTEAEAEMPEDDEAEPLPDVIDLAEVLAEALALALPAYPRAAGAELGEAVFAAPGTAPMRDADTRPFATLAGLRDQLAKGKDGKD